jgi:hypothetical protein
MLRARQFQVVHPSFSSLLTSAPLPGAINPVGTV